MRNEIVADGPGRFAEAKAAVLCREIQKKYADKLASASPAQKVRIKYQMWRDYHRRGKEGRQPSPGTLW